MIVYRIGKKKYAGDLSGRGAQLAGGRWNRKGIPAIYTSESRALSLLEVAVHVPLGIVPESFVLITLDVPDPFIEVLDPQLLPANWQAFPPTDETQQLGDQFLTGMKHLALKVPSAIVRQEVNVILNPMHPDIKQVHVMLIEDFPMDPRLLHHQ
ncbi:MAG: RES family NAD+ phosphorylase [Saprospiraceae bacterium]|nr:RES family NAD+ phosphorylase [Saprospiraceae bacterium]